MIEMRAGRLGAHQLVQSGAGRRGTHGIHGMSGNVESVTYRIQRPDRVRIPPSSANLLHLRFSRLASRVRSGTPRFAFGSSRAGSNPVHSAESLTSVGLLERVVSRATARGAAAPCAIDCRGLRCSWPGRSLRGPWMRRIAKPLAARDSFSDIALAKSANGADESRRQNRAQPGLASELEARCKLHTTRF